MPEFTITLSQQAVNKLQAKQRRSNRDHHTKLTLEQWIVLHLCEIAIERELASAAAVIREEQQGDAQALLEAAVRAERDRLIANLG